MRLNFLMIKELLIDSFAKFLNVIRIPSLYYLLQHNSFESDQIKSFSISFSLLMLISSTISFGFFDQLSRKAVLAPLNARLNIFQNSVGALFFTTIFSLFCAYIFLVINDKNDMALLLTFVSVLIFIKNSIAIYFRVNAYFSGALYISLLDFICVILFGFLSIHFNNVDVLILGNGISAVFIAIILAFNNDVVYADFLRYFRLSRYRSMLSDFMIKYKFGFPSLMYVSMFWGVSFALKNVHGNYMSVNLFYVIDICYTAIFPAVAFFVSFANIKSIFNAHGFSRKNIFYWVVFISSVSSIFLNYFDYQIAIYLLAILVVIFSVELFGISCFSLLYLLCILICVIFIKDLEFLNFCFLISSFISVMFAKKDMLRELVVLK